MIIKKIDRKIERNILIGMIVDKGFLAKISTVYKSVYFKNPYAQIVSKWCIKYFNEYNEAPFKEIKNIYDYENKKGEVKEEHIDLIESLLVEINKDYTNYDSINIPFLIDKAEAYFNQIRLELIVANVQNYIQEGDIKSADEEICLSKQINLKTEGAIDPLMDLEKLKMAFASASKPLFEVQGDFGLVINEHLTRGSFVCFQAGEKIGKTWMLYYLAIQALKRRLKVVVFQIGDMTEGQSRVRLAVTIAQKPNKEKMCEPFRKPVKFLKVRDNSERRFCELIEGVDVDYEEISFDKPLNAEECLMHNQKFYEQFDIEENKFFKLLTFPADSINFRGIDAELNRLEKAEDFIADVVVVDYMDIAAPEDTKSIGRDAINGNWKMAKSICNKRHILLLSATQANKASYGGELQSRANVAEDKRKYAHVNCMLGMNQTDEEKKANLMKLNTIVARDSDYITSRPCYILQCLRIGQPVIDSLIINKTGSEPAKNKKDYEEKDSYSKSNFNKRKNKFIH